MNPSLGFFAQQSLAPELLQSRPIRAEGFAHYGFSGYEGGS